MDIYASKKSPIVIGIRAVARLRAFSMFLLLIALLVVSATSSYAQIALTPTGDAYVDIGSTGANFGTNASLRISSTTNKDQMIFLKFNLLELNGVASAPDVTRATLKLWVDKLTGVGSMRALEASQTWNEGSITWNNKPGFVCSTVCDGASVSTPYQFVTIDVTAQVQRWLSGAAPNFGFALPAENSLAAVFTSKEGGIGPRLEITLTRINSVNGIDGLEGGGSSGYLNIGIASGGVTTDKLAAGAVTTQKVAAGAIGTSHLADVSVTSPKIAPGAVTNAQLANGAVGSGHLLDGAVTSDKIAPGQTVKSLNGLADNMTLVAGENVTITPAGNSLTISATGPVAPPPASASPKINPMQIATLRWYDANQSSSSFAVGRNPQGLAFDGANIWVANHNEGTVTKLRAIDGANLGTFATGERPYGLAFDGDHVWVANIGSATVTKLRASDGVNLGNYPVGAVGSNPQQVVFDGVNIWVTNYIASTIVKLRPGDGSVLATYNVGWSGNAGIAFDGTHIWVVHNVSWSVSKLRPSDGAVVGTFPVGRYPDSIAFDGANMWVTNASDGTVTKLRASDGANLGNLPVGTEPRFVTFDGVNVWVANFSGRSVTKIRASDGAQLGDFPVSGRATGIAFDGINIWVTNDANNTVTKR